MAGRLIRHLASTPSTNLDALALADAGAPDGSAVVADAQTSGRGRRGRAWHSPEGGLYLSYLVRDAANLPQPALMTLAAGVAVARAIRAGTGLETMLKWPNDVVTAEPPRKLAGILAEGSSAGSRLDCIVLGVGINIAETAWPRELAAIATSLEGELGRAVDRVAVRDALLTELDAAVAQLRAGGHAAMLEAWTSMARGARGAEVSWQAGHETKRGVTAGIDDEGALLVRHGGVTSRLLAGEVIWTS